MRRNWRSSWELSRTWPLFLVGGGFLMVVLSFLADWLGWGWDRAFGPKQMALALLGGGITLTGAVLSVSQPTRNRVFLLHQSLDRRLQSDQGLILRWLVAVSVAAVFVGVVLLILGRRYDFIDDIGLRDHAVAGATQKFSAHLYSIILPFLYRRVSASIPWYSLSLYGVQYIVIVVVLYLVLSKRASRISKLAFVATFLGMETLFLMRISWNASSMMAGGVALIALFDSILTGRGPSVFKSILLGGLFAASFAIRRAGIMVPIVHLVLPLISLLMLLVVTRRVSLKRIAVHVPLFLVPLVLVILHDDYYIRNNYSVEEQLYHETHDLSSDFYFFGLYSELKDSSTLLDANGWTPNDVEVFQLAMSVLNEYKFSKEHFENIYNPVWGLPEDQLKKSILYNLLHFGRGEDFVWTLPEKPYWAPLWTYVAAAGALVLFVVWRATRWQLKLFALLFFAYLYLVLVYMANYQRIVHHVVIPPFVLFFVALFTIAEVKPDNTDATWHDKILGPAALVLLTLSVGGFCIAILQLNREIPRDRARFFSMYEDFASRFGQDSFLFIRPQLYVEYQMDPLAPGDQGPETRYTALGLNSAAWSPMLYKTLREEYDLAYAYQILPWMQDNPDAYFLTRSKPTVEVVRRFIYETYSIAVQAELAYMYPDGLGAYRFVGVDEFVPHYRRSHDLLHMLPHASVVTDSPDHVSRSSFLIGGDRRDVLYEHPSSQVTFDIQLPASPRLRFSTAISSEVWESGTREGDGVQFDIFLDNGTGSINLFNEYLDPNTNVTDRGWHDHEVDLAPWAGQTVSLTLATGPGPEGDARVDWAGWGQPEIGEWTSFDFVEKFYLARPLPDRLDYARPRRVLLDRGWQDSIFQHPPGELSFPVHIAPESRLEFGIGMDPEVWAGDRGDGVLFKILISDGNGVQEVFSRYLDPKQEPGDRRWFYESVDLSSFGGQDLDIVLVTDPGPADDNAFDWAYWVAPMLVAEPQD